MFRVRRVIEPVCGQTSRASVCVCTPEVTGPVGSESSNTAVVSRYGSATSAPPAGGSAQAIETVEAAST